MGGFFTLLPKINVVFPSLLNALLSCTKVYTLLSISTSFQRFHYAISLLPLNFESAPIAELVRNNMAFTSTLTATSSTSPLSSKSPSLTPFTNQISFPFALKLSKPLFSPYGIGPALGLGLSVKAQTLEFSGSFFEGGLGSQDEPPAPPGTGFATALEEKEEPQCPPGLRKYESMVVLRPDMSEDERLAFTEKYEEVVSSLKCCYCVVVFPLFCSSLWFLTKDQRKTEICLD